MALVHPHAVTAVRLVLAPVLALLAALDTPRAALAAVLVLALLSDAVDGRLARATGRVTAFGARLDQEADALLVLVLSAVVAPSVGWWVLGLGLVRYAAWPLFHLPALRTPAPPRRWCKSVAALVAVVLAVAVLDLLPVRVEQLLLGVAAVLLAESFAHEGVDRWRAGRGRAALEVPIGTTASAVVVWVALLAPSTPDHVSWTVLLRLPVEALLLLALALLPWRRARRWASLALGLVLGLLVVVAVLDLGFNTVFDRDFDPIGDWSYLGPGVGVLGDSIGSWPARLVAVLAALVTLAVLVGLPLATRRVVEATAQVPRRPVLRVGTVLVAAWAVLFAAGVPAASTSAARLTVGEAQLVSADLADTRVFSREIGTDPYATADPSQLLAGLAGKDVLLVFVESYGRVAVQDTSYSPAIDRVLDAGTAQLDAAGYHSQSAFLTSPTFGAGSWLAHSTLQSGLWVDSERRYRQLLGADRLTLTDLFGEAGWRTVFDVPADTEDWPQGQDFYHFQQYYDSRNVGFAGPEFGYAPIPDQYTLDQLRRRELAPGDRAPVMAEVDLVSSHHPWTPLPSMVPWDQLGDGSVYDGVPEQGPTSEQVFSDPDAVKRMYGESVQYSWQALTSWLTTYDDPDLVLVVLGDHQPHGYVSGSDPGHDVPITVIAQDPAVMQRVSGWGWSPGLRPPPDAPVWRMDAFRDRFLEAFQR